MEITNDTWTLLLSHNFPIVNVFSILFSSIEILMYYLILSALLKKRLPLKKLVLFISILVFACSFFSMFVPAPYYTFINFLFAIILSIFAFKTSFFYAIFANIYFYIFTFFFSIIWLIFYILLFRCSITAFKNVLLYKIILSISVDITYYIFYKFCIIHPLKLTFFDKSNKNYLLFFNISLCISTVILHFFIAYLYFDCIPLALNIFSNLLLIAYFATSLYSLYRTSKLEKTTLLLNEEKLYNKNLSRVNDSIRGFKHDFNNIIQTIGGYIARNDMEELKAYYKDLFEDCQNNNNLDILTPEAVNNSTLYSLLTNKYYDALKVDVQIDFTILASDLSNLNIKSYELSRILGILLDNAIEASSESKEKLVHVIIKKDKMTNKHLIIIENTYANKEVDLSKIFMKGYSSKSDKYNHGIGLWEVNNYINKRNNLDLISSKNDDYFIQQFSISD